MEFIDELKKFKEYKICGTAKKPIIIYNDHRFIVPVLWIAAQSGILTLPINMLCLDAHFDGVDIADELIADFSKLKTSEEVYEFCDKKLRQLDDDWVKLLMASGLISDFVLVGGIESHNFPTEYTYKSNKHILKMMSQFEGKLDYQGQLSDVIRSKELGALWKILGWNPIPRQGFVMSDEPILIDIDCDYFTFKWRGRNYAWQEGFYKNEFDEISDYGSTRGHTMQNFIEGIINRAPFMTIAIEAGCCGGKKEAISILDNLNKRFFKNVINISEISGIIQERPEN